MRDVFYIGSVRLCSLNRVSRFRVSAMKPCLHEDESKSVARSNTLSYFESEITSWLRALKYIVLVTSKSDQIENIGRNTLIKCSLNSFYCLGNKARIRCRRYICILSGCFQRNLLVPNYTPRWREALSKLSDLLKKTTGVNRPGLEL